MHKAFRHASLLGLMFQSPKKRASPTAALPEKPAPAGVARKLERQQDCSKVPTHVPFLKLLGSHAPITRRPANPYAVQEQPRLIHQVPSPAERTPSAAEVATQIQRAAEKARGVGSHRQAQERVADLMARATTDTAAGQAAAVINAAAKARGESSL